MTTIWTLFFLFIFCSQAYFWSSNQISNGESSISLISLHVNAMDQNDLLCVNNPNPSPYCLYRSLISFVPYFIVSICLCLCLIDTSYQVDRVENQWSDHVFICFSFLIFFMEILLPMHWIPKKVKIKSKSTTTNADLLFKFQFFQVMRYWRKHGRRLLSPRYCLTQFL